MFPTLLQCTEGLIDFVKNETVINIKTVSCLFTADSIGSCAFGLECNSFKDPNAQFVKIGQEFFRPTMMQEIKNMGFTTAKKIALFFKCSSIPSHISKFYNDVVRGTVDYREKNNVHRKDFLQLLLDLKDKEEGFNMDEIVAQAFVFFLAGFETSATTLTFCFMELARNPEIQEKVREELKRVLKAHNGQFTYEAAMDMKYMQQVIDGNTHCFYFC